METCCVHLKVAKKKKVAVIFFSSGYQLLVDHSMMNSLPIDI